MNKKVWNRKENRQATEEELKNLVDADALRLMVFHPDFLTMDTDEKSENEKLRDAIDWLLGEINDITSGGDGVNYFDGVMEILEPLGYTEEDCIFGG
jgi:microsomal dipeptidase-like Zn-dependent dipeptidase